MASESYISMTSVEDCHVGFLLAASSYINRLSSNVLKTHMNILCAESLRTKNFQMKGRNKKEQYCLYCLSSWKKGNYSAKILPTPKKGKRTKRIVRKILNNKELASIEDKIIKTRHFVNKMRVKCLVCKKATKFLVDNNKLKSYLSSKKRETLALSKKNKLEKQPLKKKKKKKRKDNYHGLNPKAVEELMALASDKVQEVEPKCKTSSLVISESVGNKGDADDKLKFLPQKNISVPQKMEPTQSKGKKKKKKRNKKKKENKEKGNKKESKKEDKSESKKEIKKESKKENKKKKKSKNPAINQPSVPQYIPQSLSPCFKAPPSVLRKRPEKTFTPNPDSNQGECSAPKRRKINKWKQLINEEEKATPRNTSSLRDFLSGL